MSLNAGRHAAVNLCGLAASPGLKPKSDAAMNVKQLLPATLLALAALAQAEVSPPKSGVATSTTARTEWNTNPAYWERVLIQKGEAQGLRIGLGDWRVKGAIIEGLHRERSTGDRSAGQRLLGLPIVRLLVPQPMAPPPGGGRYFRWGESDRSWVAIAQGAAPANSSSNPLTHEARTSLISIGR